MSTIRTQSASYSPLSGRVLSPASNRVDRSPPEGTANREIELSRQLEERLTSTLSSIRQQMSVSNPPAVSQQEGLGSLLDIRA